jgi:hypothetical protein
VALRRVLRFARSCAEGREIDQHRVEFHRTESDPNWTSFGVEGTADFCAGWVGCSAGLMPDYSFRIVPMDRDIEAEEAP